LFDKQSVQTHPQLRLNHQYQWLFNSEKQAY